MTKERIIKNLKYTMEKHKNDIVPTSGTNISLMCKDVLDYLEQDQAADFREMHPQIEVVVQIDEEIYKEIAQINEAGLNLSNRFDRLIYRIKNGTVLPEGHGNLVDVKDLSKEHLFDIGFNQLYCNAPVIVKEMPQQEKKQ